MGSKRWLPAAPESLRRSGRYLEPHYEIALRSMYRSAGNGKWRMETERRENGSILHARCACALSPSELAPVMLCP